MKHPNKTNRPAPAQRPHRFKTHRLPRPTAMPCPIARETAPDQSGGNAHHDLLVLCFYPGMGPDDLTAA